MYRPKSSETGVGGETGGCMWQLRLSPRLLVLMALLWLQDICTQQQALHGSSSIVLRPQLFSTVATVVGYADA